MTIPNLSMARLGPTRLVCAILVGTLLAQQAQVRGPIHWLLLSVYRRGVQCHPSQARPVDPIATKIAAWTTAKRRETYRMLCNTSNTFRRSGPDLDSTVGIERGAESLGSCWPWTVPTRAGRYHTKWVGLGWWGRAAFPVFELVTPVLHHRKVCAKNGTPAPSSATLCGGGGEGWRFLVLSCCSGRGGSGKDLLIPVRRR